MIPGLGAFGAGGGFSQSGSADANTSFGASGGGGFYGINTGRMGGGLDMNTVVIAAAVVIALFLLRR
jgi:hypothetical protein